jgi:hypothetical protein
MDLGRRGRRAATDLRAARRDSRRRRHDVRRKPSGDRGGRQYAQVSPTPILTPDRIEHILARHGAGTADNTKGKFTPAYSIEEKIRKLIEDLWKTAPPDDLAASDRGRVIIAASSHVIINGEIQDDDGGISGDRTKIKGIIPLTPVQKYANLQIIGDSNDPQAHSSKPSRNQN